MHLPKGFTLYEALYAFANIPTRPFSFSFDGLEKGNVSSIVHFLMNPKLLMWRFVARVIEEPMNKTFVDIFVAASLRDSITSVAINTIDLTNICKRLAECIICMHNLTNLEIANCGSDRLGELKMIIRSVEMNNNITDFWLLPYRGNDIFVNDIVAFINKKAKIGIHIDVRIKDPSDYAKAVFATAITANALLQNNTKTSAVIQTVEQPRYSITMARLGETFKVVDKVSLRGITLEEAEEFFAKRDLGTRDEHGVLNVKGLDPITDISIHLMPFPCGRLPVLFLQKFKNLKKLRITSCGLSNTLDFCTKSTF